MENKKKIGLIIILLVLTLSILIGGYFTYKYFELRNSKEESVQSDSQTEVKNELSTKEKYERYVTYYKKNYSRSHRTPLERTTDGDYEISTFDGNLTIFYKNSCKECYGYGVMNNGGEILIANNIISYELINTGQADIYTLYFINEDGTVGKSDIEIANDNNKPTITKNIGNLNYIIKIVQTSYTDNNGGGIVGPLFIDINGNMYNEQGTLLN